MSYRAAAALQQAVYARLRGDGALGALVGEAIYDAVPPGATPELYVVLGPEVALDASDASGPGAEHRLTVSVVSTTGFAPAKAAAAAVSEALEGAEMVLGRGRLVGIWFRRADARRREQGTMRRIDLSFRARVEI
ncbi:MAG: hypothetical protein RL123_1536 [Pseudomonadota bacterium]|jgi:hypothetical protein